MSNTVALTKGGVADFVSIYAVNRALKELHIEKKHSALSLAYIKASGALSGMTYTFNEKNGDTEILELYGLLEKDKTMAVYIANIVRSSFDDGHIIGAQHTFVSPH